ncbi:MAG: hypothetical protein IJ997_03810 [Mycoplasmataceae bacterium]|nr:hypothetical protein [Mycoplasmataceae bacterium]
MFEISEDICNKIIEECEKYKFHDVNNLSNYYIFENVIYIDDHNKYRRLITIKKIIMYLFGTLEGDTITLDESIDAIIPEDIDDYSLGSFKKFNQPNKNNNIFCINCVDCKNCTGCIDCIGCKRCKNCQLCKKCIACNKCEYCDKCKLCVECEASKYCYGCEWVTLCSNCLECNNCQHCNNCEYCDDCLGCDNYHFEEGADHLDWIPQRKTNNKIKRKYLQSK